MGKKLDALIEYLKEKIKNTRFEGHVCLVGGCVRDSMLNKEIHDFDVVVDLLNGGIGLANYLAIQNGNLVVSQNPIVYGQKQCALYKFDLNGETYAIECSQARLKPIKIDFNVPPAFREQNLGTFASDSILRDITFNSMYINVTTGEFYDPNDGCSDLEKEIIRCPNDPNIIFKDDPLRMMRIIRFSTIFHFGIDKTTWIGIVKNRHLIKTVAVERIADELNKILLSAEPSFGLKKLMSCGLLEEILPEIYNLNHIDDGFSIKMPYSVWEHTLFTVDCTLEKLPNRLAAFLFQVGKAKKLKVTNHFKFNGFEQESKEMANEILKKYKYSNEIIEAVCTAISNFNRFQGLGANDEPKNSTIRKFIAETNKHLSIVMDLMKSNAFASNNEEIVLKYYKIQELVENFKEDNFSMPINGNELMEKLSLKPGKNVGRILNIIKEKMYENPNMTKEEAFLIAEEAML